MGTCRRCGCTYESGYNGYCSKKCYEEDHTKTCKICGKTYVQDNTTYLIGTNYKQAGCCSEKCYRESRLRYEKPRAEKTLEKWEKGLEKSQKKYRVKIDKLKEAIRSNDPEAMLVARKGSEFKRACGCMFTIVRGAFFLAFFFFFAVGLVNVAKFVRDNGNRSGTNNITVEATSETGVPTPQEEKQDDIKPYVTPDSAVTTQNVSNSASVPVE